MSGPSTRPARVTVVVATMDAVVPPAQQRALAAQLRPDRVVRNIGGASVPFFSFFLVFFLRLLTCPGAQLELECGHQLKGAFLETFHSELVAHVKAAEATAAGHA